MKPRDLIAQECNDELKPSEWPDLADCTADDASTDFVVCPECGKAVYSEAEQCHHCGQWLISGQNQTSPFWIVVVVAMTIVFIVAAVLVFWR